jgi:hypothetical protein
MKSRNTKWYFVIAALLFPGTVIALQQPRFPLQLTPPAAATERPVPPSIVSAPGTEDILAINPFAFEPF